MRWKRNFPHYDWKSLQDVQLGHYHVEEGMHSLIENAEKKAKSYAEESGMITMSDDSGFHITELGGLPGVAVRRWGGELPEEISDEEFLSFFIKKIAGLKDTSCYFSYAVSIATPDGRVHTVTHENHGTLDLERVKQGNFPKGYPISAAFTSSAIGKCWAEATDEELRMMDRPFIEKIDTVLKQLLG